MSSIFKQKSNLNKMHKKYSPITNKSIDIAVNVYSISH